MKSVCDKFKIVSNGFSMVVSGLILLIYGSWLYGILFINQFFPNLMIRTWITLKCKRFSYHLVVSVIGSWFPHPIYVKYNKDILRYRKTITISNHCSDYDWFFLLVFFHDFEMHDSRILLKRELGDVSLLGFLIRKFGHVLLNRQKAKDIRIINDAMGLLKEETKYNIAIYPEGTYIFQEALQKTRKFAEEANIAVDNEPFIPKFVLVPRKTGFNVISDRLGDGYDGIVDITIMMNPYVHMPSEDCPPYELFLKQKLVMNQVLIIDFVPRKEVVAGFLERSFKKKEDRIRAYTKAITGAVDTDEKFKKTLESIEITRKGEDTKTLYVYTPYRSIIYTFPLIALVFLVSRIFQISFISKLF